MRTWMIKEILPGRVDVRIRDIGDTKASGGTKVSAEATAVLVGALGIGRGAIEETRITVDAEGVSTWMGVDVTELTDQVVRKAVASARAAANGFIAAHADAPVEAPTLSPGEELKLPPGRKVTSPYQVDRDTIMGHVGPAMMQRFLTDNQELLRNRALVTAVDQEFGPDVVNEARPHGSAVPRVDPKLARFEFELPARIRVTVAAPDEEAARYAVGTTLQWAENVQAGVIVLPERESVSGDPGQLPVEIGLIEPLGDEDRGLEPELVNEIPGEVEEPDDGKVAA